MSKPDDTNSAPHSSPALREYCLRLIRFLADTALDPHRYFEQKYCGEVSAAHSDDALVRVLVSLADWCHETQIAPSGLAALDSSLLADGRPSFSMLCDSETRSAGLVLAKGPIRTSAEGQIVRDFLQAALPDNVDRPIAEQRLSEYERS